MVPRSTRRLTLLTATNPANSLVKSSVSRMYSLIRADPPIDRHLEGLHRTRPDPQRSHVTGQKMGVTSKIWPQNRTRPDGGPSGRACETDARGRRGACAPVAAL